MRDTKWDELDRRLTEDEVAWLETREMFDVVEANSAKCDAMDAMDDEDTETDEEPETVPNYDEWSAADLKSEVKRRQEDGSPIDIKGMTKKSEVAQALREDDARPKE